MKWKDFRAFVFQRNQSTSIRVALKWVCSLKNCWIIQSNLSIAIKMLKLWIQEDSGERREVKSLHQQSNDLISKRLLLFAFNSFFFFRLPFFPRLKKVLSLDVNHWKVRRERVEETLARYQTLTPFWVTSEIHSWFQWTRRAESVH